MGNWRRVYILGSCQDVESLDKQLRCEEFGSETWHCLCYMSKGGLCSLGNWATRSINAIGNLVERDYSVGDIVSQLRIIAKAVPSLDIKVHCGGDWEIDNCVATISVCQGEVTVGAPEIKELPQIPDSQIQANLLGWLI